MKRSGRKIVKQKNQEIARILRAIKANCYDCVGFQKIDCKMPECFLFPYRHHKDK